MAIEHVATLLCENVIQGSDGNFSFINTFVNIQLPEIPGGLSHLYIVVALSGEPGDTFAVTLEGPHDKTPLARGGDVIPDYPGDYDARALRKVTYSVIAVKPVRFAEEGMYFVVVRSGDRVVHREPFGVKLVKRGSEVSGVDRHDDGLDTSPA
jgi:uncharacterized protein DUF6941